MPQKKKTGTTMNRKSFKAQRTFREIQEWHLWIGNSLDNFAKEVKELMGMKDMPVEDIKQLTLVQERLGELKTNLKPFDRTLQQATGQRLRRARRKEAA
jgi:hypothetical protein